MLGNTAAQNLIKQGLSLGVNSKATLEWNHNNYNRPRICGSTVNSVSGGVAQNSTTLLGANRNFVVLTADGSWSQRASIRTDALNYGLTTPSNTIRSLSSTTSGIAVSSSPSSLFHFSAVYNQSYKLSFYIKAADNTSDGIILKFVEKNSSGTEVGGITRSFSMNSIQYQLKKLNYRPINTTTTQVYVSICRQADEANKNYATSSLLISDITVCEVTRYEYGVSKIYDVEDTFSPFRPGEELAELGSNRTLSNVIYKVPTKQEINGSYTAISLDEKIASNTSVMPLYLAGLNSLSYYAAPMTSKDVPVGVFAYYDKTLTTNKIVIKMLNSGPGTIMPEYQNTIQDYCLWTYQAATDTWTNHGKVGTMNKNGSLILFWNGTGWDGTARTATINETTYSLTGTTTIDGIAFTVNRIGYNTKVLGTDAQMNAYSDNRDFEPTLRFLEVSPRLIVDVSSYITEYSVNKETDSGNLPTAVGLANANSASLTLENITRIKDNTTFSIFSDKTGISPFSKLNLIDKNVKARIKYDILDSNNNIVDSNISLFTGYVESWNLSEDQAELQLFDYSKILQRKNTIDTLLLTTDSSTVSLTVADCLKTIFEQNGFSDYIADSFDINPSLVTATLLAYYTDSQKNMWENIQELLLPYGYLGYLDEYGMFNLTNYKSKSLTTPVFTFTDKYDGATGLQPNIISLTENANDRIGKVTVNYNSIYKKYSTDPASNTATFETVETPSTQILWEAGASDGVGFSNLKNELQVSDNYISLNQNLWNTEPEMAWLSYSGYAAIGTEIVKYNGQEITYPLSTRVPYALADSLGTSITYTADNAFSVGQYVTITGLTPESLNQTNVQITAVTSTTFTVVLTTAITANTASTNLISGQAVVPVTQKSIVRNEADLQYVLSKVRGLNPQNSSFKWAYTGKLLNVERGMFGTKARKHVAPGNITDITNAYPELKVNTSVGMGTTTTPTVVTAAPPVCGYELRDNVSYMSLIGNSTLGTLAYLEGKDSDSFNNYSYTFYIPSVDSNNKAYTDITNDVIVIPIGYNPSNPSLSYYLHIATVATTSGYETKLYYGNTIVAKSSFKLDAGEVKTTKQIKRVRGKKRTITVKTYKSNKLKNVYIRIDSSNNLEVYVDGSKILWYSKDIFVSATNKTGSTRYDPYPRRYNLNRSGQTPVTYTRNGKSIAIGVYGNNNPINIDSITAWQDGDFAISPKISNTVDLINILHEGDSNINKVEPYFFGINPSVYGMQIYDVDLTSGPGYNQKVLATVGSHEFKDSSTSDVTRIVMVPEEQSIVSPVVSTSFKSRFLYLNAGESYIPLSGQGSGNFNSTKLYGNAIQKTGDIQYIAESDRMLPNDSEIQISSDWIQSKENAENIAAIILNSSIISGNTFEVEAFGNPLLTIGDVVKVKYYKTNTVSDNYYMVVKASTSFNNGFNSNFTLRRIT